MQLSQLCNGIKTSRTLDILVYLERHVNDPKGALREYSEVSPRYTAEEGDASFELPYKYVARERVTVELDEPDVELSHSVFKDGFARFCWHPDLPSPVGEPDGFIEVSPTSSTRTVLTRSSSFAFMIKTDMDKRHFRFRRRLKGSSVLHSVRMNSEIRRTVKNGKLPRYAFLPESIGIVYGDPQSGTGVIFREAVPQPLSEEACQLVPYFSLYSHDDRNPDDIPLLCQIIHGYMYRDPLEVFVDQFIVPIHEAWAYFVLERGILPELHGQNTLLEINENGEPRRMVHRDFQSLYSDRDIRQSKNLPQFDKHVIGTEDNITREQQYSLVYDHVICRYLVDRLVRTFVEEFRQYDVNRVQEEIRERFRVSAGATVSLFPQTTVRFSKMAMSDNEVRLVDTGAAPAYR